MSRATGIPISFVRWPTIQTDRVTSDPTANDGVEAEFGDTDTGGTGRVDQQPRAVCLGDVLNRPYVRPVVTGKALPVEQLEQPLRPRINRVVRRGVEAGQPLVVVDVVTGNGILTEFDAFDAVLDHSPSTRGPSASELIGEIGLGVEIGARVEETAATIHTHLTLS